MLVLGWAAVFAYVSHALSEHAHSREQALESKRSLLLGASAISEAMMQSFAELQAHTMMAMCQSHSPLYAGKYQLVMKQQQATDAALQRLFALQESTGVNAHVKGILRQLEPVQETLSMVRHKCRTADAWRTMGAAACTTPVPQWYVEPGFVVPRLTTSGCHLAWLSSIVDPMWAGLMEVGEHERFQHSVYAMPIAAQSLATDAATNFLLYHYADNLTAIGPAPLYLLRQVTDTLVLWDAMLRSVSPSSGIAPSVMSTAEATVSKGKKSALLLTAQLVQAAVSTMQRVSGDHEQLALPEDWLERLLGVQQTLREYAKIASNAYVDQEVRHEARRVASLKLGLGLLIAAAAASCTAIAVVAGLWFHADSSRKRSGARVLEDTLTMLQQPLATIAAQMETMQSTLPARDTAHERFRAAMQAITTSMNALSSAVRSGIQHKHEVLFHSALGEHSVSTTDVRLFLSSLLTQYRLIKDVRVQLKVSRAVPKQLDLDTGRLANAIAVCMSQALQRVQPMGTVDIQVRLEPRPIPLSRQKKSTCSLCGCRLSRGTAGHVTPTSTYMLVQVAGENAPGAPKALLGSSHPASISLIHSSQPLQTLQLVVQTAFSGEMGALMDPTSALQSANGVWFTVAQAGVRALRADGEDTVVINATSRRGVPPAISERTATSEAEHEPAVRVFFVSRTAAVRERWARQWRAGHDVPQVEPESPEGFLSNIGRYTDTHVGGTVLVLELEGALETDTRMIQSLRERGWVAPVVGVVLGNAKPSPIADLLTSVVGEADMWAHLAQLVETASAGERHSGTTGAPWLAATSPPSVT